MHIDRYKYLIILAFSAAFAPGMACAELTQEEALFQAANLQKQGSDASLQSSTTHAMRGLMELAEQNRASAIQHGYKSYGQYRNSEELDDMRKTSRIGFLKLFTKKVVEAPDKKYLQSRELEPVASLKTTFSRLDPSFLRSGEAGKVADEFEKKSGMKREEFLKVIGRASESTISPSDPQLVNKVISRFEGFVKEIPNEEFRKNIEKAISSVPDTARTGLISKGVQKIAEIMAKMPPDKNAPALVAKAPEPEQRGLASVASTEPEKPTEATSPTPIVVAAAQPKAQEASVLDTKMVPSESGFRGLDHEKFAGGDMLGSVMQTAIDEQKEETIFKQVSKRYRAMAPKLSLARETSP